MKCCCCSLRLGDGPTPMLSMGVIAQVSDSSKTFPSEALLSSMFLLARRQGCPSALTRYQQAFCTRLRWTVRGRQCHCMKMLEQHESSGPIVTYRTPLSPRLSSRRRSLSNAAGSFPKLTNWMLTVRGARFVRAALRKFSLNVTMASSTAVGCF